MKKINKTNIGMSHLCVIGLLCCTALSSVTHSAEDDREHLQARRIDGVHERYEQIIDALMNFIDTLQDCIGNNRANISNIITEARDNINQLHHIGTRDILDGIHPILDDSNLARGERMRNQLNEIPRIFGDVMNRLINRLENLDGAISISLERANASSNRVSAFLN